MCVRRNWKQDDSTWQVPIHFTSLSSSPLPFFTLGSFHLLFSSPPLSSPLVRFCFFLFFYLFFVFTCRQHTQIYIYSNTFLIISTGQQAALSSGCLFMFVGMQTHTRLHTLIFHSRTHWVIFLLSHTQMLNTGLHKAAAPMLNWARNSIGFDLESA